jgi:hypothetical protein
MVVVKGAAVQHQWQQQSNCSDNGGPVAAASGSDQWAVSNGATGAVTRLGRVCGGDCGNNDSGYV